MMILDSMLPRRVTGRLWSWLTRAARPDLGWMVWMTALPAEPAPSASASRAGAERRFAEMLAATGDAIWRLCRFREKNPDACRDLYQEVALAIWQALPSFRGEASERTWVLRIAHNVAATHVGRAVRQRKLAPVSVDDEALGARAAASPGADPERRLDLLARLAGLDVPSQQLVLLHLEGLTTREIADVTGLTPTNVTTRLNRLRQRLSAGIALGDPAPGDPPREVLTPTVDGIAS